MSQQELQTHQLLVLQVQHQETMKLIDELKKLNHQVPHQLQNQLAKISEMSNDIKNKLQKLQENEGKIARDRESLSMEIDAFLKKIEK
jgi:predicted  nucleic acid-binding Zn-ribbon protein